MNLGQLRADLIATVADLAWWHSAMRQIAEDPMVITSLFPATGRHCGRDTPLAETGWTAQDAARVLLLSAVSLPRPALVALVETLYRDGDAAEKRAVLRALPALGLAGEAVGLSHDAIRTNDTRLLAAAMGPYAVYLDTEAWRQAVLKCVFTGVPLEQVHDLHQRADAELFAMLARFARERAAAGRALPADALLLLVGEEN